MALVTPMIGGTLEVDWESLAKLIEWHIDQSTSAVVAVGTTGESSTLSVSEHGKVIEFIVKRINGRIPVIAGTGANATAEAIDLTQAAKDVGADACLLVTPYYNKPTQKGLLQHYLAVANAVDVNQILYNVPGRTACDLLPETIIELSTVDNIVGVKEATGDLLRVKKLLSGCVPGFAVYSGDDVTACELMLMGGHGDISVTANVAPRLMSDMCAAALKGDSDRAREIDYLLGGLHECLFVEANPIPVKWALSRMGMINNVLRLPMTELEAENYEKIESALSAASVI